MRFMRRFMRSSAMHVFVREIIVWYIRLVRLTSSFRLEGTEERDRLHEEGQPFIIALWHNRIAMMPYAWKEETANLTVLASAHRDGQLVSQGLGRFGFQSISIDSKVGGGNATRQVIRFLKDGKCVGITPDGPRGPRMRVKNGLVQISAMTGAPVIPVAYSASRCLRLSSWDRFVLPLPFSRIVCRWGASIPAPDRKSPEEQEMMRRRVEDALTALTDDCDREVGCETIGPDPEDEASAQERAV